MSRLLRERSLALSTLTSLTRSYSSLLQRIDGSRSFSYSIRNAQPSNVGNVGLVAEDASIGDPPAEPITINGIKARRAKAGKLVAPTAAYSDSDMFKDPVCTRNGVMCWCILTEPTAVG